MPQTPTRTGQSGVEAVRFEGGRQVVHTSGSGFVKSLDRGDHLSPEPSAAMARLIQVDAGGSR